jgi:adenylate cyclase
VAISPLEAQMVQVLATAVGIGLARVSQEEESARLRVQLHQQFNDRLARELESDLGRLDPQDRDISILFADIRGFSLASERLGPAETFRFVSEVMEVMTESVKRHDGAVMDYVGDELIAMWNAPANHPDHARLAVECAGDLSDDLAGLSAAWEGRLGCPVRVGVGVNSGAARVGNTGTRSKPKYGALGHAVNVASRVQGATKAFGCGVLLTRSTRDRLTAPVRRLGRVKVVGIQEPVELFQPSDEATPAGVAEKYAEALARFEAGDLSGTVEALTALQQVPGAKADGPTRQLAACVEALVRAGVKEYTPVIELTSK